MAKVEWKEKKVSLAGAIVIGAVLAVLGGVIGANWRNWFNGFAPYLGAQTLESSVDWSSLDEVYNKLASSYNGDLSTAEMIEGAKKGLVDSLGDIYTVYMNAEDSSDYYDSLHGNVGAGVGIEMGLRDGYVRVLRTLPDNPARRAGVLAGDIIYQVNGEDVYDWDSTAIANRLRGEAGTEVKLTVVRDGETKEFTLVREVINNVSAYVEYDGSTAIITVVRFDEDTGATVANFANEFAGKGVKKVILDLRNNGGGYVSAAQEMLGLWLDGKTVLVQRSKHFGDSVTSSASGKAILSDMPTVVLVNGSTASASEIVAGALQDYEKATILGEKTYGKGVMQNLYTLSGNTTLKVTTAEWYTPLDRSINGDGITPDVEVTRSYEDINAMRDPQLDAAKGL